MRPKRDRRMPGSSAKQPVGRQVRHRSDLRPDDRRQREVPTDHTSRVEQARTEDAGHESEGDHGAQRKSGDGEPCEIS